MVALPALAAYITVHGGPTFSPGPGGTAVSGSDVTGVNNSGTVVGSAYRYDGSGAPLGFRAVRWDGSGAPALELGNLGTDTGGFAQIHPAAINNAGAVVGSAPLYLTTSFNNGDRAVRWDSSDTGATLLGQLGPPTNIRFYSDAFAINDAGTAVGTAYKVLGQGGSFSDYKGARAVRWNASGTAVTELGHLGTDSSGLTYATAYAINSAGVAVGNANKYTGSGAQLGYRAVRWNPGGTAATELGHLGTDLSGITYSSADAVNDAGIAVGAANKYDTAGAESGNPRRPLERLRHGRNRARELGHRCERRHGCQCIGHQQRRHRHRGRLEIRRVWYSLGRARRPLGRLGHGGDRVGQPSGLYAHLDRGHQRGRHRCRLGPEV